MLTGAGQALQMFGNISVSAWVRGVLLSFRMISPPTCARRVPRRIKAANDWQVGEVVGLRLRSGQWTLMRVVAHHSDKGGRFAICEILDWVGEEIPPAKTVSEVSLKKPAPPRTAVAQFMFPEPRKKQDQARVLRLGIVSTPAQKLGSFVVMGWPRVDGFLEEWYGIQ